MEEPSEVRSPPRALPAAPPPTPATSPVRLSKPWERVDLSDGAWYFGELRNAQKHGFGVLELPDGTRYEGQWEDDLVHGEGMTAFPDGRIHRGQYEKGEMTGYGSFQYTDGSIYEGILRKGLRCGLGIMRCVNGDVYEGSWKKNRRHGHGCTSYSQGKVYKGSYRDDLEHGLGVVVLKTGDSYEGEFDRGVPHGLGVFYLKEPEMSVYVGQVQNAMRQGYGLEIASDGTMFRGLFVDGLRHGEGVLCFVNGSIQRGSWDRGIHAGTHLRLDRGIKRNVCRKINYIEGAEYSVEEASGLSSLIRFGSSYSSFEDSKHFPKEVTSSTCLQFLDDLSKGRLPSRHWTSQLCVRVADVLRTSENVEPVKVLPKSTVTVVGDLHGQIEELRTIFNGCGYPSENHHYVFVGDLVDRGKCSLEVILCVYLWKLAFPFSVHILRGNHESVSMNLRFGFLEQVLATYDVETYLHIVETFMWLPFAAVIQDRIFVVHGGLCSETISIANLQKIPRYLDPDLSFNKIMSELLWSDPQPEKGLRANPRGAGILFGPDITEEFLHENKLDMIVRAHQYREFGFDGCHDGKVLTVFSAANYCGMHHNQGAVLSFAEDLTWQVHRYSSTTEISG